MAAVAQRADPRNGHPGTDSLAPKLAAPKHYRTYRMMLFAYAALFVVFLYGPLVMILVLSFNDSPIVGFPYQGFTTKWYAEVVRSPEMLSAFGNSVGVGVVSGGIATTLAVMLALGFRHKVPAKSLLLNLILVPILIPGIVGGIVLLIFFGYLGISPSLWTTVLVAHVNWVLPFAFLAVFPRIHGLDRSVEEAAMDLGASTRQTFLYVIWPAIRPGVIATMLFAFSLSFDEFIRTVFVSGFDRTIPVQFWTMIVDELAPELPAMAVLIIFATVATSLLAFLVGRRAR